MTEHVILVHGLARSSSSMSRMQRGLEAAGYDPIAWSYPSRRRRLEGHINAFQEWLANSEFEGPVHFIGHSLGGLIIRGALAQEPPVTVGRIIMIATPNRGAGIVSRYGRQPFSKFFFGLPMEDLHVNSESLINLGTPNAEIGIIAGVQPFHPFNPISYINLLHLSEAEHDGTVELDNTYLKGMTDNITVNAHHTFICDDHKVIEQSVHFLKHGKFVHRQAENTPGG